MNITITGDIGSGKSTVAKRLAELLNYNVIETGEIYRKYASEHGRDVLTQNQSNDRSIDRQIDEEIEALGKKVDNTIFVSRLAWHFIPDAFHIYLMINPVLAAKRIFESKGRVSEEHSSWKETLLYNEERKILELNRYEDMYNLQDASGYQCSDFIVHVGENTVEQIAQCLCKAINEKTPGFFVDPKALIPTQGIRDYNMETFDFYKDVYADLDTSVCIPSGVDISLYNSTLFINDGHHRVLAAIHNKVPFLRCPVPGKINTLPTLYNMYDYEDMAGVSFENTTQLLDSMGDLSNVILNIYKKKYNVSDDMWKDELIRLEFLCGTNEVNVIAKFIKETFL